MLLDILFLIFAAYFFVGYMVVYVLLKFNHLPDIINLPDQEFGAKIQWVWLKWPKYIMKAIKERN